MSKRLVFFAYLALIPSLLAAQTTASPAFKGVSELSGTTDTQIEISNESTKVVLSLFGGRVLKYELDGKNVLFVSQNDNTIPAGKKTKFMSAGRFDVGPEQQLIRGEVIFSGKYQHKVIGDRKVTLASQVDPKSKMQVERTFELASDSSRLIITQKVTNHGQEPFHQHYWSRTFAVHGGICVIPIDRRRSLLPNYFLISRNRFLVDLKPEDDAVERSGDFLIVTKPPALPKLGFDAAKGWVAYQTREDQLFVKKFPVYPDRKYGDPGQMNFAIWYPKRTFLPACEIEPIGPLVFLKPGESTEYSVQWFLLDNKFPKSGFVDPESVAKTVNQICK